MNRINKVLFCISSVQKMRSINSFLGDICFIMGIVFLVIGAHRFYSGYDISENIVQCDRCMYSSCSSGYLLSSCGYIQNNRSDEYFDHLNSRSSDNGIDKIVMYSYMYGTNMGECFNNSRKFCIQTHCSSECLFEFEHNYTVPSGNNVVVLSKNETIPENRIMDIVAQSDTCYSRELDVEKMYSQCILSPFHDDCIRRYSSEASKKCLVI